MNSNIDSFVGTKRVTKLVTQSETPVKTGCRTGLKEIVSLGLLTASCRTIYIAITNPYPTFPKTFFTFSTSPSLVA